ncbi:MAG TPA: type II secretion system protein [Parachlamydiaceae bacterium]|nr:type II secretion system protein [Parachlamydiaceae bacterium]
MVTIRRRAITLIEVLIVISILSLAAGIVAVGLNKAVVDQRFRTEVSMIVDSLRLAQDLMLVLGTDVHVHFAEEKGEGIRYWIELETTLNENVQREILRKKPLLKAIKGVFLADKLLSEVQESHLDVKFLSNGAVMSQGVMRLATSSDENVPKGTLESFICLAGYPRPIISSDTKDEAEKECSAFDEKSDDRISQDTFSRLPDRLKQKDEAKDSDSKDKDKEDQKVENDKGKDSGKPKLSNKVTDPK